MEDLEYAQFLIQNGYVDHRVDIFKLTEMIRERRERDEKLRELEQARQADQETR